MVKRRLQLTLLRQYFDDRIWRRESEAVLSAALLPESSTTRHIVGARRDPRDAMVAFLA
jgi:hypothetical protein